VIGIKEIFREWEIVIPHQSRTLVLDWVIWKSLKRLILNGDKIK